MWYLYTGNRVQSVATGFGNTVAVPPYGKVEIHQLAPSTESMVKRGILRPCGRPAEAKKGVHSMQVEGGGTVLQPSKFANYFEERGVTAAPELPPIADENVIAPTSGDTVEEEQPAGAGDVAASPEGGRRRRR